MSGVTRADFQPLQLVEMEQFIIFVNMGTKVSGISFIIFELIPEFPGDDGSISWMRSLIESTLACLKEKPVKEVSNFFSDFNLLKISSVNLTQLSLLEMETEPIDVKKLLKRVVNSTGSVTAVSFSNINVG